MLRHQVGRLLERPEGSELPDSDTLLSLLEQMTTMNEYFTEVQSGYLDELAEKRGEYATRTAYAKWSQVVAKMTEHQQAGTPVDHPEVRELARSWSELAEVFTGGDPAIGEAFGRLWQERGAELNPGWTRELWDYAGKAKTALDSH